MLFICLWFTLGNFLEYILPVNCYRRIIAPVSFIESRTFSCSSRYARKYCEQTDIRLAAHNASFTVSGKEGQGAYIQGIYPGDTVTLYTRTWYLYLLSFGNYDNIYQLEKKGEVYYSIVNRKTEALSWFMVAGAASFMILIFTIVDFQVKNEMKHKKQMAEAYLSALQDSMPGLDNSNGTHKEGNEP